MPHDPSTCPCCCWSAEREGWIQREHELYLNKDGSPLLIWLDTNGSTYYAPPSSCSHLDAVVGLIRELGERDLGCLAYYNGSWCWFWPEEWPGPESEPEWWWKGMHGPEPIETEDYSCVIEAAMLVLGKESDAS